MAFPAGLMMITVGTVGLPLTRLGQSARLKHPAPGGREPRGQASREDQAS